jgi:hypothetical protein
MGKLTETYSTIYGTDEESYIGYNCNIPELEGSWPCVI